MHPTQIIQMQMDLIERMETGAEFRSVLEAASSAANMGLDPLGRPDIDELGKATTTALRNILGAAYAFRVTEDMCDVVAGIASQLDDSDVFSYSNCPTQCGIVRFERPMPVVDVRGMTMRAHWAIWGTAALYFKDGKPEESGVGVWLFNDTQFPDEVSLTLMAEDRDRYEEYLRVAGRWAWVGFNVHTEGHTMGPPYVTLEDDYDEETVTAFLRKSDELSLLRNPITNTRRYMHALFITLNQTLTATEDGHVERPTKKRARKMNLPGSVTVIKMRRVENKHRTDGEAHVEWQHRWAVRGHLAWRRCGPDKPGAEPYEGGFRRRVWIPAYWKGPEDKPIKITEKLYDLSR